MHEREHELRYDVLVVGSGLAGIMAAITAAKNGASVAIASRGEICSGSSFYPGTWGLGLIEPESVSDEADLEATILEVGEGMADRDLVHTFVSNISTGIKNLEDMGVVLKAPERSEEEEYIPCFDHKTRGWHGFEKQGAISVLRDKIEELGIDTLPHTMAIELVKANNRICGARVLRLLEPREQILVYANSIVIATGGIGSIFKYNLNTDDVCGTGHYLAMCAGAKLINIEFMQMMPGYISPAFKTIYNEKMFRYSNFVSGDEDIFGDWDDSRFDKIIKTRSTHGPFTTRLDSSGIDITLFRKFLEDENGISVSYKDEIKQNQPEFIQTYFDWLSSEKHLGINDEIKIGIFAHASNGGIKIDSKCSTGVDGLYACGEATGGVHGADRIGGLSSASAIVFGQIAGKEAALSALEIGKSNSSKDMIDESKDKLPNQVLEVDEEPKVPIIPDMVLGQMKARVQEINFRSAMILRSEEASKSAINELAEIIRDITSSATSTIEEAGFGAARAYYDLKVSLLLSIALHQSIVLRRESRGSHYRLDSIIRDAKCEKNIVNSLVDRQMITDFV